MMFFRIMSFFVRASFTSVSFHVSLFHAGARNCCVYGAHCIASSTSSRRSSTTIERALHGIFLARVSGAIISGGALCEFRGPILSPPPFSVYRVNHCAHPNASATFTSQSRVFTANKHIACR